jgi:hypothetical protein
MVFLGKYEADPHFLKQPPAQIGILRNVHAQGFKAVRRPTQGTGCPVSVLGHFYAARRKDKSGSR